MARGSKKAPKLQALELTADANPTHRTITDLPPELLHMVFAQGLRESSVSRVDNLGRFLSFMRRHLPLPKTVRSLSLSDMPLNATLVRDITQLFPNLKTLELVDISCTPPSPYNHPERNQTQRPYSGWSLSGMMHILSLFEPKELIVGMDNEAHFRDTFDPACLTAAPAVRDLHVRFHESKPHKKSIANVVDALATLRALGTLLKRIGENVTALNIEGPAPWDWTKRQGWLDPFDDRKLLNIRACKKLESISLPPFYLGRGENLKPRRALSHVGAGVLAHYAPPTLRYVTIRVRDLSRWGMARLNDSAMVGLQEFDQVLTEARFPNLRRCEIEVEVAMSSTQCPASTTVAV
ncbi:hypothetical protein C8T65DRAFT_735639 [Cerioporus squamosus]|nr:hypothetical protein C8T65DRAFT_735639 [Cerioporus squamosus]